MPAVSRIRTDALSALADQLRFAPATAILRQIHAIESFATGIDENDLYPEDFVVFRITGYRPPIDEPAMLPGDALLADLSALAEQLSAGGKLTIREHSGADALRLDDLRTRWNVSAKSIERARRRGLVARRLRRDDGKEILCFSLSVVESYEARHRESLEQARGFRRLNNETTERLLDRAEQIRNAGPSLAPTAIAHTLAGEFSVSHETVRRVIAQETGPARERPDRHSVLRDDAQGIPVREIAREHKRTPASVRRLVRAGRLAALPRRAEMLASSESFRDRAGALMLTPHARTIGAFDEDARRDKPMDAARERSLAEAYHASLVASCAETVENAESLDTAETRLRRAAWLKRSLILGARRLALSSIEERAGARFAALPPKLARRAHRSAMAAIARSVDRFDPSRGGRLAGGASLELARALSKIDFSIESTMLAGENTDTDAPLDDWARALVPHQPLFLPPEVLNGIDRRCDERARELVRSRYGVVTGEPLTIAQLASREGVSRLAMSRRLRLAVRGCSVE